jgi:hypothetical protein
MQASEEVGWCSMSCSRGVMAARRSADAIALAACSYSCRDDFESGLDGAACMTALSIMQTLARSFITRASMLEIEIHPLGFNYLSQTQQEKFL